MVDTISKNSSNFKNNHIDKAFNYLSTSGPRGLKRELNCDFQNYLGRIQKKVADQSLLARVDAFSLIARVNQNLRSNIFSTDIAKLQKMEVFAQQVDLASESITGISASTLRVRPVTIVDAEQCKDFFTWCDSVPEPGNLSSMFYDITGVTANGNHEIIAKFEVPLKVFNYYGDGTMDVCQQKHSLHSSEAYAEI